jgi:YVTN family beta-propeller protein
MMNYEMKGVVSAFIIHNLFAWKAPMYKWLYALGVICVAVSVLADPLPTGRTLSPMPPGEGVGLMPLNIAVSPDGQYGVVSDTGYRQSLWCVRLSDGKAVCHFDYTTPRRSAEGELPTTAPARDRGNRSNGLYFGLAIAADHTVYAAQGAHDTVAIFSLGDDGQLKPSGAIACQHEDFPAGLALDGHGHLFVANNGASVDEADPYKLRGSVAIYDTASKKELGRYVFADSHGGTSNFPLGIVTTGAGDKTYVASERDDCVYVLDTHDPANPTLTAAIATGAHPVTVLLSGDERNAYVANSLSDTISVIDTSSNQVVGTILLRPKLERDLPGVTPLGMALSPDQKTLYAALADMNAVAVIDLASQTVTGYVPAGWYPSALTVSADGRQLLVVNSKGTTARLPNAHKAVSGAVRPGYSLVLLAGNVIRLDIPTGDDLEKASDEVLKDDRLDSLPASTDNPLASVKIQHVIYIIKENRTYDQILGDLPQGNGDPSLVLFGRDVTPNLHALAERFVLLDNIYTCGDVSGDGWVWSTQGFADAYVQRNVPYSYSGKGRKFDFEGQNSGYITGGFPATDEDGKPLSQAADFKNGAPAIPDVASTGMHIWDAARAAGLSIRNYGFFVSYSDRATGSPLMPDNYPCCPGLQPPGHDLAGITDIDFRRFDLDFPDSDAPGELFKQTGDKNCLWTKTKYGRTDQPSRFAEWNREFQMALAKSPDGSAVPQFMMVRFPTDHTNAATGGKHSPRSMVADNDYAVGQLVGAVSRSPIWNSTAIFVIEDDAQNGNDHVDCHRTTAYVISPWIAANSVDHHFYNTDSFLRTMELLLGFKPLSQYDAAADPIMDWSSGPANNAAYDAILPAKAIIAEINPSPQDLGLGDPRRMLAERSAAMDFSHPDAAPAQDLNQIIWETIKGFGTPMPPPRGVAGGDGDDDDD